MLDVADLALLRDAFASIRLLMPAGLSKCSVIGGEECDLVDAAVLAGLAPAAVPVCPRRFPDPAEHPLHTFAIPSLFLTHLVPRD